MNWDALGSIAELLGAVAVVASLVYLASQVRSGTKALNTTMRDAVFRSIQDWNLALTSDGDAASVFQRGVRDSDRLSEDERYRFFHILYSFFKVFENVYLHALDGSLDESVWRSNRQIFLAYVSQPGVQAYWKQRSDTFDPRFRALVDSIAAASPAADALVSLEPGSESNGDPASPD